MLLRFIGCRAIFLLPTLCLGADTVSGPEAGKKVPSLKVFAVTGPIEKQSVDYAARRADKTTVYVVIPQEKWTRPVHRFLHELGKTLSKSNKDLLVVAVWLTEQPEKTKEYLPIIAQYYEATALTCFEGEKAGPENWNINDQADITVVVTHRGNVIRSVGYLSVNETLVGEVAEAVKKAVDSK